MLYKKAAICLVQVKGCRGGPFHADAHFALRWMDRWNLANFQRCTSGDSDNGCVSTHGAYTEGSRGTAKKTKVGELERCFDGRHRWSPTYLFIPPKVHYGDE